MAATDILYFLLMLCGTTLCYEEVGVVGPVDPYVYIGDTLTLWCNLTQLDLDFDSSQLYFTRHNDTRLPDKYVTVATTQSIVLRLPVMSPADGGMYLCSRRGQIINQQKVRVEYKPVSVRGIKCIVYNWESMTCHWNLTVQYVDLSNMHIMLAFVIDRDQQDCPHMNIDRTSCSWKKGEYRYNMEYYMGVEIRNTITKDEIKVKTEHINTSEIVEPAPVKNLNAVSIRNTSAVSESACVQLSWTHDKIEFKKVYRVKYRPKHTGQWKIEPITDRETSTICGLQYFTEYDFSVSCKPRPYGGRVQGFWSHETTTVCLTKQGVPTKAPQIQPGSYVETNKGTTNVVTLYFQPVSEAEANGKVKQYDVTYMHLEPGSLWENASRDGTVNHIQLVLDANIGYVFRLRAVTSVGFDQDVFSQIYVYPSYEKPAVPRFRVEARNATEKTTVTVIWDPVWPRQSAFWRNLSSYTVFWCKGFRLSGSCEEPINSVDVASSDLQFSRSFSEFESYMFGVAVNGETYSGETISSGFQWNKCTYIQNAVPLKSPSNFRLSDYQPDDSIKVEWTPLTCKDTDAYIERYIISVCLSTHRDNCTGEVSTYKVENTQVVYTVGNLQKDQQYMVWIKAVSKGGDGPNSEPHYTLVVNRDLTSGVIGGIAVASLFILIVILCCFIFCSRRVYITVKQKYFVPVPIEIPHTLPPLPPIPMPPRQLSTGSESSEGIYEKIDGPPSPCSSTESTTGVNAPLIHSRWKLSSIKNQIYGRKREQRNSYDSGQGSLSQSADTLLMRLHPSNLRRHKKAKQKRQSESDSGVIMEGRGHVNDDVSDDRSRSDSSEHTHMSSVGVDNKSTDVFEVEVEDDGKIRTDIGEVSPYSCVDIVHKINCTSEKLRRKAAAARMLQVEACVNNAGSTLSLPPASCQVSLLLASPLDFRTKSAGNELDLENCTLSSMVEGEESSSSDGYSERSTIEGMGYTDNEMCGSGLSHDHSHVFHGSKNSPSQHINSYIQFVDGEILMPSKSSCETDSGLEAEEYGCVCHMMKTVPVTIGDGYITQDAAMETNSEENCGCERLNCQQDKQLDVKLMKQQLMCQSGLHAVNQVLCLPPHYFSSSSKVDSANTTEL